MKIILGVDEQERTKAVAGLIEGLAFARLQLELTHVVEQLNDPMPSNFEGMIPNMAIPDLAVRYVKMVESEAKDLLNKVQRDLDHRGHPSTTKLLKGFSANAIIEHAENSGADLLALGSTGRGPIEGAILGSVGRKALTNAKCSVLIAKKEFKPGQKLKVVLATDHSDYANRCIQKLMAWHPRGISQVVVTTIYPAQFVKAMSSVMDNFKADLSGWVRKELDANNKAVIDQFATISIPGKSRVESGPVGDTLERVMAEEQADLLIVGAQGRGFMERLTIGSVSLDQAIRRPYSLLVIRSQ